MFAYFSIFQAALAKLVFAYFLQAPLAKIHPLVFMQAALAQMGNSDIPTQNASYSIDYEPNSHHLPENDAANLIFFDIVTS